MVVHRKVSHWPEQHAVLRSNAALKRRKLPATCADPMQGCLLRRLWPRTTGRSSQAVWKARRRGKSFRPLSNTTLNLAKNSHQSGEASRLGAKQPSQSLALPVLYVFHAVYDLLHKTGL